MTDDSWQKENGGCIVALEWDSDVTSLEAKMGDY